MPKYECFALVSGSKFLGIVEADSPEEAKGIAEDLDDCCICFCHQCIKECDDPQITEIIAQALIEEDS